MLVTYAFYNSLNKVMFCTRLYEEFLLWSMIHSTYRIINYKNKSFNFSVGYN